MLLFDWPLKTIASTITRVLDEALNLITTSHGSFDMGEINKCTNIFLPKRDVIGLKTERKFPLTQL